MSTKKVRRNIAAVSLAVTCAVAFTPSVAFQGTADAAQAKLKVSPKSVTVTVGSSKTIKAKGLSKANLKKVQWTTNSKSIKLSAKKGASVKVKGVKKTSKAVVTAKYGSQKVKVKVTVKKKVAEKLSMAATSSSTTVGSTIRLKAKGLTAAHAKKVKWSVSDSDVAELKKTTGKNNILTGMAWSKKVTVTATYGSQSVSKNFKINVVNPSVTGNYICESYVNAVLYMQSAEVAGLQQQAYAAAKESLDNMLASSEYANTDTSDLAIVCDIDATLMDDSTYIDGAIMRTDKKPWNNEDWQGYYQAVASTADTPIPGAQEFLEYADSKGVSIYYITNRPAVEEDLTVQQLKRNDFPQATAEDHHVQVMDSDSSDKASRRYNVAVTEGKTIIMLIGDSVNDFISSDTDNDESSYLGYASEGGFDRTKGNDVRTETATSSPYKDYWGKKWIILPNSAYGDWIKATWFKKSVTREEQVAYVKQQLVNHSYLNTDKYSTWYTGTSPIGPDDE